MKNLTNTHALLLLTCTLLIASCQNLKNIPSPQTQLKINTPSHWAAAHTATSQKTTTGWLQDFTDPALHRTVTEALTNNQNLQAAAARLRAAQHTAIITRASRLPTLTAGTTASANDATDSFQENYTLNLSANWEPDLWGRLRDLDHATAADIHAATADLRAARLSLAATTAKSYCNLITAQAQLTLAKETLTSFQKNLRIIERNYRAGVPNVRALDVQLGRTNVSSAARNLKAREQETQDAARNLEVLLGRYPSATTTPGKMPTLKKLPHTATPAHLLERRPDLAAARARLYATAKRADAAKKNLLPNLSLRASTANASQQLAKIFTLDNLITSIAANLTQDLFTAGSEQAEANIALQRNQAALHDYAQTALEAFRETESTLAAETSLAQQETHLRKEVEQAALAEKQSERDYSEGIEGVDILSVLESQRRANNARSTLIRLINQRLQNRIDLHLALGGSI